MSRAFKERQKRNLLDRIDRLTKASNELKYEETTASESSDGRTATGVGAEVTQDAACEAARAATRENLINGNWKPSGGLIG